MRDELVSPLPAADSADPSERTGWLGATTRLSRRRALSLLGAGGLGVVAVACAGKDSSPSSSPPATTAGGTPTTATNTASTAAAAGSTAAAAASSTTAPTDVDLAATPEETGGPFPADGSNDNGEGVVANVLADARSVRSDIRSDLDGSNTQDGVPMTLHVNVVGQGSGAAVAGAAVYVWHCTKDGGYSQYNSRMVGGDFTDHSYLRGVQLTDADGAATFQTILPGRYSGRAFHIHFEVYADGTYSDKLLTSQMAMDDDLVDSLYAAAGYDEALRNDTDNDRDNVFADGVEHQLMTVTGDVSSGLTATFTAVV